MLYSCLNWHQFLEVKLKSAWVFFVFLKAWGDLLVECMDFTSAATACCLCAECQSAQSNKVFMYFSRINITLTQRRIYMSAKKSKCMLFVLSAVVWACPFLQINSWGFTLSYANKAEAGLWRKNLKANDSGDTEVQFSIRKMLLLFRAFESIMRQCCTHPAL